MGLLRWMRGGDDNSAATSVVSAGLAEIDGLFRPSKHKQTEHVEESKRRRVDVSNAAGGIDLERGVAIIRGKRALPPTEPEGADVAESDQPRTVPADDTDGGQAGAAQAGEAPAGPERTGA